MPERKSPDPSPVSVEQNYAYYNLYRDLSLEAWMQGYGIFVYYLSLINEFDLLKQNA